MSQLQIAPIAVVRLSGFAFRRLEALESPTSAALARRVLEARAKLAAAGAELDETFGGRYLDHPQFLDPETRNIRRRRVKQVRKFAREGTGEVPRAAFDEIGALFPDLRDRLIDLERLHTEARALETDLRARFAEELEEKRRALQQIYAQDERLREAVFLESSSAYARIELLAARLGPRNADTRPRERMAARYLQRFFAKNDTNSMCGPDSVAHLRSGSGPARLAIDPPELGERRTYFAYWAAVQLHEALGARAGREHTLRLRRNPALRSEGGKLAYCVFDHDATTYFKRKYLRADGGELVELCEFLRTPRTLAETMEFAGESLSLEEDDAGRLIERLIQAGAVLADYRLPFGVFDPLQALLDLTSTWPDRQAAERDISELRGLVDKFGKAPLAQRTKLADELGGRFEAITGAASTRSGGKHYADRMLLHEECHARVTADLGAETLPLLQRCLGPLVRATALPTELARENVRAWFSEKFGEGKLVPALEVHRLFDEDTAHARPASSAHADNLRSAIESVRSVVARAAAGASHGGTAVIDPRELEAAAAPALQNLHPGFVSVDLLMGRKPGAAPLWVLGEMHGIYWFPTVSLGVASEAMRNAALEEMRGSLRRLAGGRRTAEPLFLHTQSTDCRYFITDTEVEMIARGPRPGSIPFGDLGMRLEQGRFRFETPDGAEIVPVVTYGSYPFFSYTGWVAPLHDEFTARFFPRDLLPPALRDGDSPRLSVGDLVFRRRSWVRPAGQLAAILTPGANADEADLFLRAQNLQKEVGCGRFAFASISGEPKPVLLDFNNFFFLESFYRMLEHAPADSMVRISEMLPGPDELLLEAPDGRRTSELRIGISWG